MLSCRECEKLFQGGGKYETRKRGNIKKEDEKYALVKFYPACLQATLSRADTHKKAGLIFECPLLLFALLEKYMEPKYHNASVPIRLE